MNSEIGASLSLRAHGRDLVHVGAEAVVQYQDHPRSHTRGEHITVKVWIDQDLCTGDGLCEEIAPEVFTLLDDGLAYVKEADKIFADVEGNPQGAQGMAIIPDGQEEAVIESAEECPGECIFIEVE